LLFAESPKVEGISASYNEVVGLFRSGKVDQACSAAESMIHSHPRHFGGYNLAGLCAAQRGNADKAEILFSKSIDLNPSFADSRINLATSLAARGMTNEAMSQLRTVVRLRPDLATAHFNLGRLELASGNALSAVRHLRQARRLAPQDGQISLGLAEALLASRQSPEARQLINEVIQAERNASLLLSAATLALRAGDASAAQAGLSKASRLNGEVGSQILVLASHAAEHERFQDAATFLDAIASWEKTSAQWNALRGYADYKLGHPEPALQRLRKALELEPQSEDYYLKIAELMLFHNSTDAARAFLETGLERLPGSALVHYGLAVCYFIDQSNPKRFELLLEAALKLDAHFEPALSLLCQNFRQSSEWPRLQETADRLIAVNPSFHEGHYYKALALIHCHPQTPSEGFLETARALLEQAVRLNPDFEDSRIALGKLLIDLGDVPGAIQHLEHAAALSPQRAEVYFHLAGAYRKNGQPKKQEVALKQFQALKDKDLKDRATGWKSLFRVSSKEQ
jgi:tetratricopeptide (TPR) repeat protein